MHVEKALQNSDLGASAKLRGEFEIRCLGIDGVEKWVERTKNLIVNAGLNHLLNAVFHGETQIDPWYVGLKGSGSPASGDTLASHAGWSEISDYSGRRKAYTEATSTAESITNSANKASFTFTAAATVAGAFIASASSGTTGTLFSAADFSSAKSASTNDTLEVTYTISAADDGA